VTIDACDLFVLAFQHERTVAIVYEEQLLACPTLLVVARRADLRKLPLMRLGVTLRAPTGCFQSNKLHPAGLVRMLDVALIAFQRLMSAFEGEPRKLMIEIPCIERAKIRVATLVVGVTGCAPPDQLAVIADAIAHHSPNLGVT
jgi:hypothetical protein